MIGTPILYVMFALNFLFVLALVLSLFGDFRYWDFYPTPNKTDIIEELELLRLQSLALFTERYGWARFPPAEYSISPDTQAGTAMLTRKVVPKIVHFIWFQTASKCHLRFHQFISILSAHKHIQPDNIYFWHNSTPCGEWWDKIKPLKSLVLLRHEAPTTIFGNPVQTPEHQADFMRLLIMRSVGGIYMDTDVVALRSWDDLLVYNITMSAETSYYVNNGVILSTPDSEFIRLWYDSYRIFTDEHWGFNSLYVPMLIARRYPELIHIEWGSFHEPLWSKPEWLYKQGYLYDWSNSYAVHLWYRFHKMEHTAEDIRTLNTTMGEIFRYIYYGSKDILSNSSVYEETDL